MESEHVISNLDDIDEDVDGGIDGQHEVIPLGKNLSPRRPVKEFSIVKNLISFISICKNLQTKYSIIFIQKNLLMIFIKSSCFEIEISWKALDK